MTLLAEPSPPPSSRAAVARLGVVQYLNTLPLVSGLERVRGLELQPDVPARLFDRLLAGEVDAALCSSIDYQRTETPLVVLPCGLLGCDGETLTVRLYSRTPFAAIRSLAADVESHTSRVLATLLLQERHGAQPATVDLPADPAAFRAVRDAVDAVLMIGDKAILHPPGGDFAHTLDLGAAWKEWTGLPFTFAVWMAPAPTNARDLARLRTVSAVLDHQRRRNASRVAGIAARQAPRRGWDAGLARRYLRDLLRFAWTPGQQAGLERFWLEAQRRGLTRSNRRIEFLPE
jgi:chorismate dehydratase